MSDLPAGARERIAAVPMPDRVARLARDHRGYPIPRFVEYIDGKPDFRIMNGKHLQAAVNNKRCWICGEPLGRFMTFVVGPMCIVNLTSAEPPSHHECADYSAKVCPFLAIPEMRRIEATMPTGATQAGIGIRRNPGVVCLWTTRKYKVFKAGRGVLFEMGEPTNVEWWSRGRTATRAEVLESMKSGKPSLEAEAIKELDKSAAFKALETMYAKAQTYLPA